MANPIDRLASVCGLLECDRPEEMIQGSPNEKVETFNSDASSIDRDPHFLATATEYFTRESVEADFRRLVEAGQRTGSPVTLGRSRIARGDRNLDWMLGV